MQDCPAGEAVDSGAGGVAEGQMSAWEHFLGRVLTLEDRGCDLDEHAMRRIGDARDGSSKST